MNHVTLMARALLNKLGPWRFVSLVALVVLVPCTIRLALDSGISWDEEMQLEYGKKIFEWFQSGFSNRSAFEYRDLYLYGGLFDFPSVLILRTGLLPWGEYESRHVMTALLALLGVVAVWLTANRVAGPRAGTLAALVLLLTPTWVGHGLFNCKDIPFGVATAFVVYVTTCITLEASPISWRNAMRSGVAVGCALGFRPGGMFLFAFPFLAACARLVIEIWLRQRSQRPLYIARNLKALLVRLGCGFSVAWAIMVSTWPWAQVSPLLRPLMAASIAKHFAWSDMVLFNGTEVGSDHLPRSYLPIWFGVTLPEVYLVSLACAIVVIATISRRWVSLSRFLAIALVALSIALPLGAVFVLQPVLYDAHRHFVFFLPSLSVLAGLALNAFIFRSSTPRGVRAAGLALFALAGLDSLGAMRSLHPYEYVYFNRISGGLARQASRFETDYWGLTYREAFKMGGR